MPAATPPTTTVGRAETPVAFLHAILRAYAQRGLDPAGALAKAHIAPQILENPHNRITALQMELVSGAAMHELDDEALGWFERRLPWGSYGMLVRASLTAPNLGVALARWCRHHGLLTRSIALELTQHNGVASLVLTEQQPLGEMQEFCVVSTLRNALGVACWLTDSRIPLRTTQLRFPPPAHASCYRVLFEGTTYFGAAQHCLQFDAGYLALPVRRDEAAVSRMLQRALLLTVRPYRRDRLLVDKVRQALVQHPPLGRNAEALAQWLAISSRSLHRQLREEGASLQAIKDRVRRDIACELLLRSRKPIKQVAQAAGFDNDKSFIRAFRLWTGCTPDEYRAHGTTGTPQ